MKIGKIRKGAKTSAQLQKEYRRAFISWVSSHAWFHRRECEGKSWNEYCKKELDKTREALYAAGLKIPQQKRGTQLVDAINKRIDRATELINELQDLGYDVFVHPLQFKKLCNSCAKNHKKKGNKNATS